MDTTRKLDLLHELQGVDSGIKAFEDELAQLPRALSAAEEDARIAQAQVDEAKQRVDAVLKKRRELEQEIESIGQTIVKYENQKLNVKTNEEFQALNHQIDHQKQRRSGLEDEVLISFDDEESIRERAKHLKAKLEEVQKVVDSRKRELEERSAEDRKRLEQLRARREELVPEIEKPLLSRYEVLRTRKSGLAVAGVDRGSCGGCHSALPPQVVNEVKKRNAVLYCEFCGRFLIHEPGA